jgi:hypothetical protein
MMIEKVRMIYPVAEAPEPPPGIDRTGMGSLL